MLKHPAVALSAITLLLALSALQSARADTITSIVPASPAVTVDREGKATMVFTVNGSSSGNDGCGIWINYGDGDSPDTRVVSRQDGLFPRQFEHTFKRAGQFAVVAKGERVKSTPGCTGQSTTTINVLAQGGGRRRDAVAAACPSGWGLVQASVNRQTGAYTCGPVYPSDRMDCGPGLRYFESAGTIGCRARGQGRER